jgi:2-oxoglutarate ferredoxin oxidoreductase subunit delta
VSDKALTRGTVVIDVDLCKGCDLCIDACPPGVLRMTTTTLNSHGFRYPELLPGCTACKACSQICPDFVFQVWKFDEPVELEWHDGDAVVDIPSSTFPTATTEEAGTDGA